MLSALRLEDSQIVSISYITDVDVLCEIQKKDEPSLLKDLRVGYTFNEMFSDAGTVDHCQINLGVGIFLYLENTEDTFVNCEIELRGRFGGSFTNGETNEEKKRLFSVFGVKALFDEARTYISLITCSSPYMKIVVPDIDAERIVQEAEEGVDTDEQG